MVRFTILARQLQHLTQRKQAEELLSSTLEELQQADEELRVQNEELLASNEQLLATQRQLEASRQTYVDLYDFAPVGYCTFDEHGIILEANLTLARLVGIERGHLINMRFYHAIVEEDRDRFFLYLRTLFTTQNATNL